jgi:hypothetical protein
MTCIMVSSAAMTNIRRIHHYWKDKKKEERRKIATEMVLKDASNQRRVSFSALRVSLFHGCRSFILLPKVSFCG